jgi:hypothetical protein
MATWPQHGQERAWPYLQARKIPISSVSSSERGDPGHPARQATRRKARRWDRNNRTPGLLPKASWTARSTLILCRRTQHVRLANQRAPGCPLRAGHRMTPPMAPLDAPSRSSPAGSRRSPRALRRLRRRNTARPLTSSRLHSRSLRREEKRQTLNSVWLEG